MTEGIDMAHWCDPLNKPPSFRGASAGKFTQPA
jgi:hypothetical protein